jgi:hypothetical protein
MSPDPIQPEGDFDTHPASREAYNRLADAIDDRREKDRAALLREGRDLVRFGIEAGLIERPPPPTGEGGGQTCQTPTPLTAP